MARCLAPPAGNDHATAPAVYQTLLELQMLDITGNRSRSAPTAHYSMAASGCVRRPRHRVDGLYAIGERRASARREPVGGNSLIELLVYGRIAGESAHVLTRVGRAAAVAVGDNRARGEVDRMWAADGPENVRALQHRCGTP